MKKLLALILSATMLIGTSIQSFAEETPIIKEDNTETITEQSSEAAEVSQEEQQAENSEENSSDKSVEQSSEADQSETVESSESSQEEQAEENNESSAEDLSENNIALYGIPDVTPPELTSEITIDKTEVEAPGTITVTANGKDDISGVSDIDLYFKNRENGRG